MRKKILTALIILGFTTILSQLIVIRELLNVFQGNELIIGLILCIWMLLTAAGSRLGQLLKPETDKTKLISRLFLIAGSLPPVMILLLYLLEALLFPPGTTKGLAAVFFFCLGLLLPCCLVAGVLFTLLATTLSDFTGKNCVSEAYGWESGGSMVAGLLFSLLLAYFLTTFRVLSLIMFFSLLVYRLLFPVTYKGWKYAVVPNVYLILTVILFLSPADKLVKSFHYKNQELVYTKDTPYGYIAVTQTDGQYNYFENGTLLFSTENQQLTEEAIHFALLQHPKPEKVLVVSGGIAGMTEQVLKYKSVRHMDYLEINPWLVMAENQFSGTRQESRLQVITMDARKWIRQSEQVYDAIIINTPDPSSALINRYYTLEFFREAKRVLLPTGVFSVSLSSTVNYMSTDAQEINRIIYHTLKSVFRQVEVIPGERNYFIASDGVFGIDIASRIQRTTIENEYVNPYFMEDDLLKQRNRKITEEISAPPESLNTDLAPLAYFLQIRYWLSIYKDRSWPIPVIVVMLMLFIIFFAVRKTSPVAAGVFTSGFAGASAEFLILIVFQIIFGNIYQMIGIIVAFYMAGLMTGAVLRSRRAEKTTVQSYVFVQLALLLLVMLIPIINAAAVKAGSIPGWMTGTLLFIVMATIAFTAGLAFNKASRLEHQEVGKIAGSLYGIDLAGAACGTLLISLVCFPLLGIWLTCVVIAGLMGASVVVILPFITHL